MFALTHAGMLLMWLLEKLSDAILSLEGCCRAGGRDEMLAPARTEPSGDDSGLDVLLYRAVLFARANICARTERSGNDSALTRLCVQRFFLHVLIFVHVLSVQAMTAP
jgi:hypothetical protein